MGMGWQSDILLSDVHYPIWSQLIKKNFKCISELEMSGSLLLFLSYWLFHWFLFYRPLGTEVKATPLAVPDPLL